MNGPASWKDRTALVTGGTRGIGLAVVQRLQARGARIAFTYLASDDAAAELEASAEPGRIRGYRADACDLRRAREVVASVSQEMGPVDLLVNNAGIARDRPVLMMSEAEWDDVIATNLRGTFNYSRAVVFSMVKRRCGAIVNISSLAGIRANPGQAAYGASKAGIIQFTRTFAMEVARFGVRANCVVPGVIETDMSAAAIQKFREQALARIPCGRFGTADDVAEAALFLLEDRARYINGQALVVDGGLSL